MNRIRKQVLARYAGAARTIEKACRQVCTASEALTGNLGHIKLGSAPDAAAVAMQQLLGRQAYNMLLFHQSVLDRSGESQPPLPEVLPKRLADLASIALSKFYSYRYDLLPDCWRQIYADTLILTTHLELLRSQLSVGRLSSESLDGIVENLDRAIITTGAAGSLGDCWIEQTLDLLEILWFAQRDEEAHWKTQHDLPRWGHRFSSEEPFGRPAVRANRTCCRLQGWTLHQLEQYLNQGSGTSPPAVFTDLMQTWPALSDRPWSSADYLLSKTFGGRRLVPVEIGRSYVDEGWGQALMPFRQFLQQYIYSSANDNDDEVAEDNEEGKGEGEGTGRVVGYLAQHNLFRQIPSLRNDIQVPDLCWADVPRHPTDTSKDQPPISEPHLNAWFGPARTITPLHTDGYHNLLCQVVGAKYVRLYPPQVTEKLRPRSPEHGVDMSNTSAVDVGVMEGWDPLPDGMDVDEPTRWREELANVVYWECIIAPGDALLIPIGWWHYVRSLSVSFSVSFWWN